MNESSSARECGAWASEEFFEGRGEEGELEEVAMGGEQVVKFGGNL